MYLLKISILSFCPKGEVLKVSFKYLKVWMPRILPCPSPVTSHLAKWILKVAEQPDHRPRSCAEPTGARRMPVDKIYNMGDYHVNCMIKACGLIRINHHF
jgi:hypothetical protein